MHSSFAALAAALLLATLGLLAAGLIWFRGHWVPPRPPAAHDDASADALRRLGLALILLVAAASLGSLADPSGGRALAFLGLIALAWSCTSTSRPAPFATPLPRANRGALRAALRPWLLACLGVLGLWSLWLVPATSLVERETIPAPGPRLTSVAPASLHLAWDAPSATVLIRNDDRRPRDLADLRMQGEDWGSFVPSIQGPPMLASGAEVTVRVRGNPERFVTERTGPATGYRRYRNGRASLSFRLGKESMRVPVTFHGNHPAPPWRASGAIALLLVFAGLALRAPHLNGGPVADEQRPLGPRPLIALSAAFALASLTLAPVAPAWCTSWPFASSLIPAPSRCVEGLGAMTLAVWPQPVPPLLPWLLCTWSLALASLSSHAGIHGALRRVRASTLLLVGFWLLQVAEPSDSAGAWIFPCLGAGLLGTGSLWLWTVSTEGVVDRMQRLATLVLLGHTCLPYLLDPWWVRLPHLLGAPTSLLLATIAAHVAFWIFLDGSLSTLSKRLAFLFGTEPQE